MLQALEMKVLNEYEFKDAGFSKTGINRKENEYLLCLRKENYMTSIDKVKREDVTAWEIFKSYFGAGKLANLNVSLTAVADYLENRADLQGVESNEKAYQTIHHIATRMLVYKKAGSNIPELWKILSSKTIKVNLTTRVAVYYNTEFKRFIESYHEKDTIQFLPVTPFTTVAHLKAQFDVMGKKPQILEHVDTRYVEKEGCYEGYQELKEERLLDESLLKKIEKQNKIHFIIKEGEEHTFCIPSYRSYNVYY